MRADDTARAGLLLAALLGAWALPGGPHRWQPCRRPAEWRAAGDASIAAVCEAPTGAPALRGPSRLLFGERLDANCAPPSHLEALPGIGPARAAAIARARAERPFRRVEDLLRVPGIGPATLARIAPALEVRLGGAPAKPVACRDLQREPGGEP